MPELIAERIELLDIPEFELCLLADPSAQTQFHRTIVCSIERAERQRVLTELRFGFNDQDARRAVGYGNDSGIELDGDGAFVHDHRNHPAPAKSLSACS